MKLLTQQWHDYIDAFDTATLLVTAEVTEDKAMLSMLGGRRQQQSTKRERYQEMVWASNSDREDAAAAMSFVTSTMMVAAIDFAWMAGSAAATFLAMVTTQ